MPRTKGSATTSSAIRQVRRQASSVLAKLHKDIRAKEIELARLKRDEQSLGRLVGRGVAGGLVAGVPRAAGGLVGGAVVGGDMGMVSCPLPLARMTAKPPLGCVGDG